MWELIVLFALVLPVKARKFLDRLVLAYGSGNAEFPFHYPRTLFCISRCVETAELDTDIALYILYGILGVSALVCLILVICIAWFCW